MQYAADYLKICLTVSRCQGNQFITWRHNTSTIAVSVQMSASLTLLRRSVIKYSMYILDVYSLVFIDIYFLVLFFITWRHNTSTIAVSMQMSASLTLPHRSVFKYSMTYLDMYFLVLWFVNLHHNISCVLSTSFL